MHAAGEQGVMLGGEGASLPRLRAGTGAGLRARRVGWDMGGGDGVLAR